MSSLVFRTLALESNLKLQYRLIHDIDEELEVLLKQHPDTTDEEFSDTLSELLQYRVEILEQIQDEEKKLELMHKKNNEIVLRQLSFKKGGQSW